MNNHYLEFPNVMIDFDDEFDWLLRTHDRMRLFSSVLSVLVDDLFQQGRETMALGLFEYASGNLTEVIRWEIDTLLSVLARSRVDNSCRNLLVRFTCRHCTIARSVSYVIAGLGTLSQGQLPPHPLEFVVEALRFSNALCQYLDWLERTVVPLAATALSASEIASLESTLAERLRNGQKSSEQGV